ncbi:hypothetical protein [Fuscibacter oryzae]|uniref:Uncharacterized protein n=1 Tax=Fuscibacter oryzae TaxID=2803939 RepID=A0A8J7MNL0_9RHOB|nr:hypothetical protein [Fuscibacter oryzae]MBL4926758.1 hypothetical protein [Fuscibacter oryzae]
MKTTVNLTALLSACLVAAAMPVWAEEKKPNLVANAPVAAPGGAVTLAMAQELFQIGLARKDALSVLTAARLAASVDAKTVERSKTTEGTALAGQEDGTGAPVDAKAMLAKARELAGEDETLAGLVEDAEAEGTRGRMGGASQTLSALSAGQTDVWQVPFYGESYAEVAVIGDGDANLDVLVTDENGNTICFEVSWSDKMSCSFTPAWNGYFHVAVQNNGAKLNSYYLLTN